MAAILTFPWFHPGHDVWVGTFVDVSSKIFNFHARLHTFPPGHSIAPGFWISECSWRTLLLASEVPSLYPKNRRDRLMHFILLCWSDHLLWLNRILWLLSQKHAIQFLLGTQPLVVVISIKTAALADTDIRSTYKWDISSFLLMLQFGPPNHHGNGSGHVISYLRGGNKI